MATEEIEVIQRLDKAIIKFQLMPSDNLGTITLTETRTDVNKKSNQRNFWNRAALSVISKPSCL